MKFSKILDRQEMKKVIAGYKEETCTDVCNDIAQACFAAAGYRGPLTSVCTRQLKCCQAQCSGLPTC